MYQILKDFAGPIATVAAALAAVLVTAYFSWHQKKLAEQQGAIAKEKLRRDLYDRRYRVFEATRKLLCEIATNRIVPEEALRMFTIGTSDAPFLFDDDFDRQLREIPDRARKLRTLEQLLDPMPESPQRTNFVDQAEEQFKWLEHQLELFVDKFKPFLKLQD